MSTRHLRLVRDTDAIVFGHATPVHRNNAWLAPPLNVHMGSIEQLLAHIPHFERRPFRVTTGLIALSADHPRWDVIVRIPNNHTYSDVPVGVVSKTYSLVQHRGVLRAVACALEVNGIDSASLSCELRLSEYDERMEFSVHLPAAYEFDPQCSARSCRPRWSAQRVTAACCAGG